nr:hypothetical protein [Caulobacter sp. Root655]
MADHANYFESLLETDSLRRSGRPAPFHRNLRKILDLCWPNETLTEQLEKTWITDAVLCSAKFSGGPIDKVVENVCVTNYLARQIAVLPNAFIVTLGGKAARRLRRQNLCIDFLAQHPSARPNTSPEASWQRAAASFRTWLELAESDAQLERI